MLGCDWNVIGEAEHDDHNVILSTKVYLGHVYVLPLFLFGTSIGKSTVAFGTARSALL